MERIRDYTVLDMEMTGLDAKKDKVTEIGAVRIRAGCVADTYSCLVNPGIKIPENVVRLTGITDEMAAAGRPADEALRGLLDFMGTDLLVGQNVGFDYSFLAQWCLNKRIPLKVSALDTLKISRKLLPKEQPKKLEALCEYFGVSRRNAHRALDDALETWQIFEKLQDMILKTEEDAKTEPGMEPEKLLKPAELTWHAKRQTPATPQQIKRLKEYMQQHGITEPVNWENLTRSEASRLQDRYFACYGR